MAFIKQRLEEQFLGDSTRLSRLFGANPVFRLPMFLTIVRRPINEKIGGPTAHLGLRPVLVPQDESFLDRGLVAFKRSVDIVSVIDDMPAHGHFYYL